MNGIANVVERRGITRDPPGVAVGGDVVGAGFERSEHDLVLAAGGDDDALAAELPAHRSGFGQRSAQLREDVAHIGARSIAVVGEHVDEQPDTARRIPFVGDRLVGAGGPLTGTALDRPVDQVVVHLRCLRLQHHRAQRRVGARIATAVAGRHFELTSDLGEDLGPRLVGGALLVLDRCPFGMAGHDCSFDGLQMTVRVEVAAWFAATMERKYWCNRVSAVSSGWNDATTT
ncbi:MAG: Uncharacterized protein FD127_4187 [Acidimicrobiaceae bacterium]|nr:MAG: Uncharacterized protein FD127_4187 [Acidimicrobiaceae bacterium]